MAEIELMAITRSGGAACSCGAVAVGAVCLSVEGHPDILTFWCARCLDDKDLAGVLRLLSKPPARLRSVSA